MHRAASRMLAIICGTVTLVAADDPALAAGVAAGCCLGQWITPDLDQAETGLGPLAELASFVLWAAMVTAALLALRRWG